MDEAPGKRFERLSRAVEALLRCPPDAAAAQGCVAGQEELRDLLEPLLGTGGPEDGEASGADDGQGARSLGDFRILREIGRGGMGVVHEAWQVSLDRRVALKVLSPHLGLAPQAIVRFVREARTAAALRHPGIVEVHGVGSEGDTHWLAMAFVAGAPLDRVLERLRGVDVAARDGAAVGAAVAAELHGSGAEDARETGAWTGGYVETALRLVLQVADALDHAHRCGVVHRDVKPSNILVCADGRTVLTDFGLAREAGLPSLTQTGTFAGTPCYVAPEQALGEPRRIDGRADVFSLGATLYEVLTLQRAFDGASTQEVLHRIVHEEPVDPQKRCPALAPDLGAIVLAALAKEPGERYPGAAAFAADLRAFLDYRPVQARRASAATRIRRWVRRRPVHAALVLALALGVPAVAGLSGYLLARQGEIAAGAAALRQERLEALLARGFVALGDDLPWGHRSGADRAGAADPTSPDGIALAAFDAVLAAEPACREAIAGKAIHLARRQRGEEALRLVQEAAGPKPATLQAWILHRLGRGPEAGPLAREGAGQSDPFELFLHGMIAIERGHAGEREAYTRAYDLLLRAALACPVARLPYHSQLAHAAWHTDDLEKIRLSVDTCRAKWPAESLEMVALYTGVLDPAAAAAAARTLVERWPAEPRWRIALGHALLPQGQGARAVEHLEAAVALDPRRASSHVALAQGLITVGRFDAAIAAARTALALDPGLVEAHVATARALVALERPDDAIVAAKQALDAAPGNAAARVFLGIALSRKGRTQEAIACLRQALAIQPLDPVARSRLGGLLLESGGSLQEVEELLRSSLALRERQPAAYHSLGAVLVERGDLDGARAAFERALQIADNMAETWCALGDTMSRLGRPAEAAAHIRKGHELGSTRPGWPHPSAEWVRVAEAAAELEPRLLAISESPDTPAPVADVVAAARLALARREWTRAVSLYERAFAQEPALEQSLRSRHRVGAARAAWRAGFGQERAGTQRHAAGSRPGESRPAEPAPGEPAPGEPTPGEAARLRQQAAAWLLAEVQAVEQALDAGRGGAVVTIANGLLEELERSRDFATMRDPVQQLDLPSAEQEALRELWSRVAALRRRVGGPAPRKGG